MAAKITFGNFEIEHAGRQIHLTYDDGLDCPCVSLDEQETEALFRWLQIVLNRK